MKKNSLSEYNLPTKIFWWLMLFACVAVGIVTIYKTFSFSAGQFAVLLIALVISALITQHQITIPKTEIQLTAKEFIIFWGVMWLGMPGGVLLAAGVSVAAYIIPARNEKQRLLDGFISVVAAFAAGSIFYIFLKQFADFAESAVAENPIPLGWLIIAAGLAVIAYYLFSIVLNSIFYELENPSSNIDSPKEKFVWSLGTSFLGLAAAFIMHFALLEFGLYFGLVVLSMVIAGHFTYQLYVARLAQKTKEISEASRIHLATVEALATAIDARDQVGIGHVRRTQIYAVGIGEILELSATDLQALNTGALLHDIGKLAVPDHILNKPGRLTPAEREKVKIHSSVGASILEKIDFPYPVVPTVKYHHEMWDGNGYPEGLKGENIPLTARIMAVADAFDTLRGARPYRAAISRDDARRFLLAGAGKQFDPKIVDAFLRNLKKFETEVEVQGFSYAFDKEDNGDVPSHVDDNADQSYVEQIKRANREVFTLYELAKVFSSSLSLPEALSVFVKKISELVPFDTCAVYLMNESEEFAEAAFVQGLHSSALKKKRVKPGEGATGYVLKKQQPVHKIEPGLDFIGNHFELGQSYRAMTSLPLIADERLLGAVSLYSRDLENYEEEHLRLLETISRIASDAISLTLQHAESESRALTDPMTDLPNARSLQMQFEKEVARAKRSGNIFQLLMLDLDGFKAVNDTFGHKAGDKLLKELAKVMNAQLRDYDFLARYAGDEFVAIVPETDAEGIIELCGRIEQAVKDFVLRLDEGKEARVGISIGTAGYPAHGTTLDQVLIAADTAMYAVKADRKQAKATRQLPPIGEFILDEGFTDEKFIVELDESHVISSAIN